MKHKLFGLLLPLSVLALTGCGAKEEAVVLRVYNCEDYIADNVVDDFIALESEKLGKTVKVVYDTYDTNETMLSSLKTGKTTYDLICASDYTLQKMVNSKMCQPINMDHVPNYTDYCPPFLLNKMASITTKVDDQVVNMGDYSVGYMWGTLGILYNPAKVAKDKNLLVDDGEGNMVYDEDMVKGDMASWASLWDKKYANEMSVKDSMRDTYSVGIMMQFDEEIRKILADSGYFTEDFNLLDGKFEDAMANYNPLITDIFNRCDQDTVKKVEQTLLALKENVFGFEVDSGKDDIVKGLVGMNLAWSGDAVYSMDRGDYESGQTIYYSVPETGGNIWFDGWVMMAGIDDIHRTMAEDFLNFLCDPEVASSNMDSIGYTSYIAGDVVHELIRDWYDPRSYAMYVYHEADWWEDDDFLYDEEDNKIFQTGFDIDNDKIEDFDPEYGILDMTGSTYEAPVIDGVAHTWDEYYQIYNEKVAAMNELLDEADQLEEVEPWGVRNLTYMFEGTIEYDGIAEPYGDMPETNPYLFYTDEIEEIEVEENKLVECGRQFYAQYPDHTMIPKLAVMSDYGPNNEFVLAMWQNVKSNNLPLAGVVVFAIILVAGAAGIIAMVATKHYYHRFKIKRRKEQAAKLQQPK